MLADVEARALAECRRDPSVDTLNAARRRLAVAAESLGEVAPLDRFDEAVAALPPRDPWPSLLEVVAIAARTPLGDVLSIERWSDHWRAVVTGAEARWTATDDAGGRFGGERLDGDVVRFDPELSPSWTALTFAAGSRRVTVRR